MKLEGEQAIGSALLLCSAEVVILSVFKNSELQEQCVTGV